MGYHVVIPARYGSTRLPGKPLVDIAGRPMVVRVAERALACGASSVVVATDDGRVVDAVAGCGATAMLTRDDHPSGSDRVMEVAESQGWSDDEIVVNVQGDEPLIPPAVIDQVAELLVGGPYRVATLCEPITRAEDAFDPNIVKVVANRAGRALYFSRAPIPWSRDTFADGRPAELGGAWRRHIGIYAYRMDALRSFVAYPPSRIEQIEALEQLRLLDRGHDIVVAEAVAPVPGGVDTPADLDRVRAVLA
ncbi:MAG: 3-deoxy-manno-octulosonate cytidylyltransferase [Pseudomonadales bacterium]|nr:3-deoxy-manno-octulosonate cytidylyltransferase [Pseudomonadales bacterium]